VLKECEPPIKREKQIVTQKKLKVKEWGGSLAEDEEDKVNSADEYIMEREGSI